MSGMKTLILTAISAITAGVLALLCSPAAPAAAADLYPYGQCTYYAKAVRPDVGNFWGNARYWAGAARRAGFPVSSRPQVGDIVVFGAYVQGNSPYGHVGLVNAVRGNQFQVISMWGNEANGRIHVNWRHTGGGVSFIHKKGTQVAAPAPAHTAKRVAKPTKPVAKPTKPAPTPAKPVTRPAKPATKATPVTKPAQPATKATKPATKPAQPVTKPARP